MELSKMNWSGFFCSCGYQIEVSAIAVDTEGTVYLKGECLEEDKDIVLKITFQELMKLAFNKGSNGSIRSLD